MLETSFPLSTELQWMSLFSVPTKSWSEVSGAVFHGVTNSHLHRCALSLLCMSGWTPQHSLRVRASIVVYVLYNSWFQPSHLIGRESFIQSFINGTATSSLMYCSTLQVPSKLVISVTLMTWCTTGRNKLWLWRKWCVVVRGGTGEDCSYDTVSSGKCLCCLATVMY